MTPFFRKLTYLGLFAALASVLGYVETLLPFFPGIPGIKPGFANLAVLFLLIRFGWRDAALVSTVRILIVGFLFGNVFGILYSLSGAAVSIAVMSMLKKRTNSSVIMLSIAGGVTHNLGQLFIAVLLTESLSLIFYAPALLAAGVIAGLAVGVATQETLKRVRLPL